jgi:hypothetical protein
MKQGTDERALFLFFLFLFFFVVMNIPQVITLEREIVLGM